jgi:hypothetical protein
MPKSPRQTAEERASLVGTSDPDSPSFSDTFAGRWQRLFVLIMMGACLLFLWEGIERDPISGDVELKIQIKKPPTTRVPKSQCEEACSKESPSDLTSWKIMLDRLQASRQKWVDESLKVWYGESHYQDIFEPTKSDGQRENVGKQRAFVDPNRIPKGDGEYEAKQTAEGPAWPRMIRKWTIKLLQVQLGVLEEQINGNNVHCVVECEAKAPLTPHYTKFIWANGGHSASAGHGNFYRESYTAYLGRALQPLLGEIGLDFQAKNYAMVRGGCCFMN